MLAPIWWPPRGDNHELAWNLPEQVAGNAYLWLSLAAGVLLAIGPRSKKPAVEQHSAVAG
jgi:alpha-1,2-mannosyltransferase